MAIDNNEFVGILEKAESGRWAIKLADGRQIEVTSGEIIEIYIEPHWIKTSIEYGPEGYYPVVRGLKLCKGLKVRQ